MENFEAPQPQPEAGRPLDDGRNWPKVILAAVLGFGLLAASAYCGYYYGTQQVQQVGTSTSAVSQPTPTPTSTQEIEPYWYTKNWESYENTQMKFSVKHPKSWIKQEPTSVEEGWEVSFSLPTDPTCQECFGEGWARLTITYVPNPLGTLEEATEKLLEQEFYSFEESPSVWRDFTIAEEKGLVIHSKPEHILDLERSPRAVALVDNGSDRYFLHLVVAKNGGVGYQTIFAILHTFKFLD